MKHELTEDEGDILAVIITAVAKRGFPPQTYQIAERLGIPESTTRKRLMSLAVKGYIKHRRYVPNGIRLLKDLDGDPIKIVVSIEKVTV